MFNVQVENHETLLSTSSMSRAEARKRVAEFKAGGVKAKVVPHPVLVTEEDLAHNAQVIKEWEVKHDEIRAPYMTITEELIDGTPVLTAEEAAAAQEPAVAEALEDLLPPVEEPSWPSDLGDRIAVGSLQPGQAFYSLDGRPGTFIEMVGHDAKVSFEGKTVQWSNMSPVLLRTSVEETVVDKALPNKAASMPAPNRKTLFGFSATAVIRWLGRKGLDFSAAKTVLLKQGVDNLSDSTIKIQLRAGVKGERGDPAPLTEAQAAELLA